MSRVLVIPDLHHPACHPGALAFCKDLYERYDCSRIVSIGDMVDHQATSFHTKNPNCPGPKDETKLTKECLRPWVRAFPEMIVTIGNHDNRVLRLAESVGITDDHIRPFAEVWETPGWKWVEETIIDDVYYFHGEGRSGKMPAFTAMEDHLMSVVMGHCHTASGIHWKANPLRRTFGLDVGCLIDIDAFQFAYGKHMRSRPVLSAAVVLDGTPHHFIMPCGRGEKYHKSRFKGKRNGYTAET